MSLKHGTVGGEIRSTDLQPLRMIIRGLILLITSYFTLVQGQEDEPGISVMPNQRLVPNSQATFICRIDPKWTGSTVFWWRRIGQIVEKIGSNSLLEEAFMSTKRYTLSQWGQDNGVSYRLSIKELRYEDSGEIGCSVRDSETYFVSLAICEDVETFECMCVQDKGWINPDCFEKHPSINVLQGRYNRATTGLGVCLAIAIIFGLVMSVIVGLDCMARIVAKRNRKKELNKLRQGHDPEMYQGDEVKLDPNDSASNLAFEGKGAMPPKPERNRNYTKLNTGEVAHTNPAFNHEDDGYQEIRDTAQTSPYRRYPNGPPMAGAQAYNEDYQGSPGGPRSQAGKHGGAYGGYENSRSPGSWSTHSAAPNNFRYPEPQSSAPEYTGEPSPRNVHPNPRNAYSERRPVHAPEYQNSRLEPRQLYLADENQSSPYNNLSHSNYEEYAPNHSGSYIDKTDTVV